MALTQECSYCVFPSEEGIFVIAISARDTDPFNPIVLYDGGENALFYRNGEDVIVLDYLNPKLQGDFFEASEVIIAEVDTQTHELVRHYSAKMRQLRRLPSFELAVER